MKHLTWSTCIACVLAFPHSMASAQDDAPQDVITMEDAAPAEAAYPEMQTEAMPAPEPMPPRGPGAVEVILMFFMFGVIAVVALIGIFLWCRIYSKTGYGWAFGLLMMVPIANFVMLCVLAFGEWPVLRELKSLRQQLQQRPPASM